MPTSPLALDARSALFDVFGDHLRQPPAGGQAPVAALVRLLAPLGVQEPAVRTAVSRMMRQGWLSAVRLPAGPGYALTPKALQRLDDAGRRIYRTSGSAWDYRWHLVLVVGPSGRARRERLHALLAYLGYGCLGPTAWVAPRPAGELDAALAEADAVSHRFTALHEGPADTLTQRAWDLPALAALYRRFLDDAGAALAAACTCTDEGAFAARVHLVHAWRSFLNVDPGLPAELLPADWPGTTAAAWFDEQAARLHPAARRFVETCLATPTPPAPAAGGLFPCQRLSGAAPSCSTSSRA